MEIVIPRLTAWRPNRKILDRLLYRCGIKAGGLTTVSTDCN